MLVLVNGAPRRRGPSTFFSTRLRADQGAALLEWMLSSALGLLVVGSALSVFLHQARVALNVHQRQLQLQDLGAMAHALRAELRMAGHRLVSGQHAAYDQLQVEGSPSPLLGYLCDACGASDINRRASFRLQSGALMHRGTSTGSYQALNEVSSSGLRGWQVVQGSANGCKPWIQVRLEPQAHQSPAWTLRTRPRNLGPLSCEPLATPGGSP